MPDSTDQLKPLTITQDVGGNTIHGVSLDVNQNARQIGFGGNVTHIFIQCPNLDSSGATNNASVFFGTARFQEMELVPGQYSPKLECYDLRQIWIRVALPAELEEQKVLNVPYIGVQGIGRMHDRG